MLLHLYNKTNIDNIIASLNENIYSIKTVSLRFNNKKNWNVNDFNLNKIELEHYIASKLIGSQDFMINPVIHIITESTDEIYYRNHQHDAEILYFGLPFWVLSGGILLIATIAYNSFDYVRHMMVNRKMQSCEIVFYVRRKK